jgi:acylphosphatase
VPIAVVSPPRTHVSANESGRETVRRRVTVHGHVQGVFFRAETAERASALGLAGWVRNRTDGSVEAVIEGEPGVVETLIDFMRRGPRDARVKRLEVETEQPEHLSRFQVAPDAG